MAAKFKLYKNKPGDFCWQLVETNGQVIASGETYKTKERANNGIESVKNNDHVAQAEEI